MFKGFSKRNTSSDLPGSIGPASGGGVDRANFGKENARPHSMFLPRTVQKHQQVFQETNVQQNNTMTTGGPRYSTQKLKGAPDTSDEMTHAFDKLLVSYSFLDDLLNTLFLFKSYILKLIWKTS